MISGYSLCGSLQNSTRYDDAFSRWKYYSRWQRCGVSSFPCSRSASFAERAHTRIAPNHYYPYTTVKVSKIAGNTHSFQTHTHTHTERINEDALALKRTLFVVNFKTQIKSHDSSSTSQSGGGGAGLPHCTTKLYICIHSLGAPKLKRQSDCERRHRGA